jgi:hypothetical protein
MGNYNNDYSFKSVSESEQEVLDGVVAGTASANKAVVLGANKNIDTVVIADGGLKLGSGAGTAVARTAAQINLLVQGAEAGYKIKHGVATIGAASEDIATGLTTVTNVIVSMVGDPSMTHMYSTATVGNQTGQPASGSIRIKSWKPTAANDCTPQPADTVFSNVAWIAIGT